MILVIKICKIPFHYFEFVKPIEDIIKKINKNFKTIHYEEITTSLLSDAEKVIICGTSLKDNSYLKDIEKFSWLKDLNKPFLGICGGMHILGLVYDGTLKKTTEIGLKTIKIEKNFFGYNDKVEVYELHSYFVESKHFETIGKSDKCIQAVKHKNKPIYAVLFHPEVRNKKLIQNFLKT